MLETARARAAALGEARAETRRGEVAAVVREALPRASVTIDGEDIVIAGRGIASDPALRWIAGELA